MDDDKFYPPDEDDVSDDELGAEIGDVEDASGRQMSTLVYIMPKDKRRTSAFMSRSELAEIKAIRAEAIAKSNDAQRVAYIPIDGLSGPVDIAEIEIAKRQNPYVIHREVGTVIIGGKKYRAFDKWEVNELGIPDY